MSSMYESINILNKLGLGGKTLTLPLSVWTVRMDRCSFVRSRIGARRGLITFSVSGSLFSCFVWMISLGTWSSAYGRSIKATSGSMDLSLLTANAIPHFLFLPCWNPNWQCVASYTNRIRLREFHVECGGLRNVRIVGVTARRHTAPHRAMAASPNSSGTRQNVLVRMRSNPEELRRLMVRTAFKRQSLNRKGTCKTWVWTIYVVVGSGLTLCTNAV